MFVAHEEARWSVDPPSRPNLVMPRLLLGATRGRAGSSGRSAAHPVGGLYRGGAESLRSSLTRVPPLQDYLPTLLCLAVLVSLSAAVLAGARVPGTYAPALAVLRGGTQLMAIGLILGGVITDGRWVGFALVVMFTVATVTATRRIGWSPDRFLLAAASMALGVGATLAIVFATGALDFTPRYVLAMGGIVIGNVMTITSLGGRRFIESVGEQWELVEGWLALGASHRQATRDLARRAMASALIPSIDQTRTAGLVTLPGAFVGAIFGGISPLDAGRFQVLVLAAVMAAGSLTAVATIHGLAGIRWRPAQLR